MISFPTDPSYNMLVNYRDFFSPPLGVSEAISFANAVREREAAAKNEARRSIDMGHRAVVDAAPENIPDDALSSTASEGDEESDQVRWISVFLYRTIICLTWAIMCRSF